MLRLIRGEPLVRGVFGAVDEDERLTALGWWGRPEAMLRV